MLHSKSGMKQINIQVGFSEQISVGVTLAGFRFTEVTVENLGAFPL